MKVLIDKKGDIHLTETENRDELFLIGSGEVLQHDNGPILKVEGGPFDEIFAYAPEEGDKLRKEE